MVAAKDGDATRVADLEFNSKTLVFLQIFQNVFKKHLERHQEGDDFNRVESPVYVVAHEEVVCVRDGPANLEQLLEVVELGKKEIQIKM